MGEGIQKPNCLSCPAIPHCEYSHETQQPACINHPKAQEYLNAGVIQELERRMKVCAKHSAFDKENIYEQTIALIRGGVK